VLDVFLSAKGFSCSLDALYRGLGISKLQFLVKKKRENFCIGFFYFLFIKTVDPNPVADSLEMLDPEPKQYIFGSDPDPIRIQ
jgi:hypothetical protein